MLPAQIFSVVIAGDALKQTFVPFDSNSAVDKLEVPGCIKCIKGWVHWRSCSKIFVRCLKNISSTLEQCFFIGSNISVQWLKFWNEFWKIVQVASWNAAWIFCSRSDFCLLSNACLDQKYLSKTSFDCFLTDRNCNSFVDNTFKCCIALIKTVSKVLTKEIAP